MPDPDDRIDNERTAAERVNGSLKDDRPPDQAARAGTDGAPHWPGHLA
jgi:hypothetical protein